MGRKFERLIPDVNDHFGIPAGLQPTEWSERPVQNVYDISKADGFAVFECNNNPDVNINTWRARFRCSKGVEWVKRFDNNLNNKVDTADQFLILPNNFQYRLDMMKIGVLAGDTFSIQIRYFPQTETLVTGELFSAFTIAGATEWTTLNNVNMRNLVLALPSFTGGLSFEAIRTVGVGALPEFWMRIIGVPYGNQGTAI